MLPAATHGDLKHVPTTHSEPGSDKKFDDITKITPISTDCPAFPSAEGKAGQSVEMGVIFVMSSNFLSEPGSEWVVGTCFKSPCVAAGNNELTSLYR